MAFPRFFRPPVSAPLAGCVAALVCATAAAQDDSSGDEVGFAGAEICRPGLIHMPAELEAARAAGQADDPANLPILIEADRIETRGEDRVVLTGNARVAQGRRGVYAERIVYHRDTYRAEAEGNVRFYTANGDEIRAHRLNLVVDTFVGEGEEVRIRVADDAPGAAGADDNTYARARAAAQRVRFGGRDATRLEEVSMSTCAEGDDDVLLSARQIDLDHAAGFATARAMTVKFKGVPIFYFPRATFPIDDRRKTGFLFPSAGYDGDSGLILQTPYYLNIAPQYDATLTPRLLSRRGAQLSGQFRYLHAHNHGALYAEFLPSDNEFDHENRHAFRFDHRHVFGENWRATVDWQRVSDSAYLRDFSGEIDGVSSSYVAQKAQLAYSGEALRFSARLAGYDSVNDAIARAERPYQVLPQLEFAVNPQSVGAFRAGLEAEYTDFRHDDRARVHGARLRARPHLSLPFRKSHGYIEPRASLHTIRYALDDNAPGADNTPSVNVPVYAIDSGLFFERAFERGGTPYFQTLEPRLLYVHIQDERKQNEFPDFDTSAGGNGSFAHYFRENRFFGGDRVGDTEHIAVGVTSRIVRDDTGRQRLKLSLGEVFYLEDRRIGLTPDGQPDLRPQTESTSGLLTEVTAAVSDHWAVTGFARWAHGESRLDSLRLAADYHRSRRRNAALAYTFDHEAEAIAGRLVDSEQINVEMQTPLAPLWQLQGEVAYSLEEDEVHSSAVSIGFDGCCWALRASARRYLDGEGGHKNRFMLTLELDDLGRINSRL